MSRKLLSLIIILAIIIVTGAGLYWRRHDVQRFFERASLPKAQQYQAAVPSGNLPLASTRPAFERQTPAPEPKTSVLAGLPAEINLAVPFTAQAPHANWELPYKEFCEEASALMAASYVSGEAIPSAEFADQKLLEVKDFEEKRFGYYEDTTAAETVIILTEHFGLEAVALLENPTADDLKQAVAQGKLVIVPAAGRLLGNPYFTAPGPLYHMLVIKGYTKDGRFIVNDPGTRRGADYIYSAQTILEAMHDWRPDGDITRGRKVVIIVG